MQVTSRGYRAWRVRPMSQRQRGDMVILAHIREQHRLSLHSYGRPRMTEELPEMELRVGHRWIGRLMRMNDIKTVRTQKYRVTHGPGTMRSTSGPTCWDQRLSADGPNSKMGGYISYISPVRSENRAGNGVAWKTPRVDHTRPDRNCQYTEALKVVQVDGNDFQIMGPLNYAYGT